MCIVDDDSHTLLLCLVVFCNCVFLAMQQPLLSSYKSFGRACLLSDFTLDSNTTHLNHGSFGSIPRAVYSSHQQLLQTIEFNPDKYYRYDMLRMYRESIAAVAQVIGTAANNVVFVHNATTGVHTALSCAVHRDTVPLSAAIVFPAVAKLSCTPTLQSSYIITFDTIYSGCAATVKKLCIDNDVVEIRLPFMMDQHDMISAISSVLSVIPLSNVNKFCLLCDHICSDRGLIYPVHEICRLCRAAGVISVVDGAHCLGLLDIDVTAMQCDYYTSNCHKWYYTPRGCAILYIAPQYRASTRAPIGSIGYGSAPLLEFRWQGTRDISSWLCIPAAQSYIQSRGGLMTIMQYMRTLRTEAVALLMSRWSTTQYCDDNERMASLALVEMPALPLFDPHDDNACKLLWWCMTSMYNVTAVFVVLHNKIYVRISCAIYNELSDYERLADCVLELSHAQVNSKLYNEIQARCAEFLADTAQWNGPF